MNIDDTPAYYRDDIVTSGKYSLKYMARLEELGIFYKISKYLKAKNQYTGLSSRKTLLDIDFIGTNYHHFRMFNNLEGWQEIKKAKRKN